jgi:ribose/xylose/arabinose/galactoside ABC-type transport system permease subunit|nr:ribose ABC transporter permease [Mesotoga sp. H07.pep.5.3]
MSNVDVSSDSKQIGKSSFRDLLVSQYFVIIVILLAMGIVMSFLSPVFLTSRNLLNVLLQTSINITVAVGVTMVILTGGIDLGVGSVVALTGVTLGTMLKANVPIPLAFLMAVLVGALTGIINGLLVSKGRVPAFVATLGMMSAARGLSLIITGGQSIYVFPKSFLNFFGIGYLWFIPMPVVIASVVVIVAQYSLSQTRFGRYVYAIGGNSEAARLAGVKVTLMIVITYMIAGITYAVGGTILTARLNSAQPIAGVGYELDAIAAAVIGGTSLSGGVGTIWGTVLGALIMGVLRNGLNLLNISSYIQQVLIGTVIVGAVLIDRMRNKA